MYPPPVIGTGECIMINSAWCVSKAALYTHIRGWSSIHLHPHPNDSHGAMDDHITQLHGRDGRVHVDEVDGYAGYPTRWICLKTGKLMRNHETSPGFLMFLPVKTGGDA